MLKILPRSLRFFSVLTFGLFLSLPLAQAAESEKISVSLEKQGSVLLSGLLNAPEEFNAVDIQSNQKLNQLSVDFGKGWEEIELHDDYGLGLEALIFTSPTKQLQFRSSDVNLDKIELKISFSSPEEGPDGIGGPEEDYLALTDVGVNVISRTQWGADESLRIQDPDYTPSGPTTNPCAEIEAKYGDQFKLSSLVEYNEQGQELRWPLAYSTEIKKFSVHHSDSDIKDVTGDGLIDAQDYQAIVRAIYRFHTVSRGWGDIGYNYLIDPLGNIYEGRYGGEMAIGAHSLCFNHAVMGIALIGNYENQEISPAAFKALTQLMADRSKKYNIDPLASSEFNGKYLDNIFGHKDVRATSCPGAKLYAQLSSIRDEVARLVNNMPASTNFDFNAEFVSMTPLSLLDEEDRQKVTLKFKNTGKQTWESNSWLHVNNNTSPYAGIVPLVPDKTFVGADLKETSVKPGGIGTFEIEVQSKSKEGEYSFQVSPVINGKYKISRAATWVKFTVQLSKYDYEVISLDVPYGNQFQGEHIVSTVKLKNTGEMEWQKTGINAIRLGAWDPLDRESEFIRGNRTRMGYMVEETVKPGEIGEFKLDLHVPVNRTGRAVERFVPVVENVRWLRDKNMGFMVTIFKPIPIAKTSKITPVSDLMPGEKRWVEFNIRNTGAVDWTPSDFTVTASGKGFLVEKNIVGISQTVKPGESVKVGFWVTLKATENGTYTFFVRPKYKGIPIHEGLGGFLKNVYSKSSSSPTEPKPTPTPTPTPPVEPVSTEQPFRVKISHDSPTAVLTANTDFVLLDGSNQILSTHYSGTEVSVNQVGNEFEVKSGAMTKKAAIVRLKPKTSTGITEIKTMERRPAWNDSLNDNRFRGLMEMRVIDGKVAYINELPLEDYVKGLAEVSNNSPTEKQKVIAVLARTYARFYMDSANRKFPGMPYDGSDDPDVFQKYLGYGVEMRSPNFVKAAEATRDVVVTYSGKLVKTPYFNQSDGKTRSAQEVWGWTNTPYLISVPDPWSEGLTLNGHGVGLSGHGATKQAEEGKTYDQIIKYYYSGVKVEKKNFN